MAKKKIARISDDEAVKNLLIISVLKDGVDPEIVAAATGIPEMTIRWKFPMKLIRTQRKRKSR